MRKTILITGATDGIGRKTAELLTSLGHCVLVHGRTEEKAERTARELGGERPLDHYVADLSDLGQVEALAQAVAERHPRLDVLINNAGVYLVPRAASHGLDLRFMVNTIAPYLLTLRLLPQLGPEGRVVNLSSAAQAPVDLQALAGVTRLGDHAAYAQSKAAITAWTRHLAETLPSGPTFLAVNPGSLLASKMVKEAFGVPGSDLGIGAEILRRAALDDAFGPEASGRYWDNDSHRFADPHPDAMNPSKAAAIVQWMDELLAP